MLGVADTPQRQKKSDYGTFSTFPGSGHGHPVSRPVEDTFAEQLVYLMVKITFLHPAVVREKSAGKNAQVNPTPRPVFFDRIFQPPDKLWQLLFAASE